MHAQLGVKRLAGSLLQGSIFISQSLGVPVGLFHIFESYPSSCDILPSACLKESWEPYTFDGCQGDVTAQLNSSAVLLLGMNSTPRLIWKCMKNATELAQTALKHRSHLEWSSSASARSVHEVLGCKKRSVPPRSSAQIRIDLAHRATETEGRCTDLCGGCASESAKASFKPMPWKPFRDSRTNSFTNLRYVHRICQESFHFHLYDSVVPLTWRPEFVCVCVCCWFGILIPGFRLSMPELSNLGCDGRPASH